MQPQPVSLSPDKTAQQSQLNSFQQLFQPKPTAPSIISSQSIPLDNNSNNTSNRLQEQFSAGTRNARALPTPSPVANNLIASTQTNPVNNFMATTQVRPSFQDFYARLSTIVQSGKNATLSALVQNSNNTFAQSGGSTSGGFIPQGSGPNPSSVNTQANQQLGKQLAAQAGWTGAQWNAFNRLVMKESGWNNNAQNPTSTAYGIGQFLNSTWAGYGAQKTSDPRAQIQAMIRYIKGRYGDPISALNFHNANNYY